MTAKTITVDDVWLRNGRIYFPMADRDFFPEKIGGRSTDDKGTQVLFVADGKEYPTDIRCKSSALLSPRSSFKAYLHKVGAKHGGTLKVERVDDRRSLPTYQMEYVG